MGDFGHYYNLAALLLGTTILCTENEIRYSNILSVRTCVTT